MSSIEDTANPMLGAAEPVPPRRRASDIARRIGADRVWLLIVLIGVLVVYLTIAFPATFPRFPSC